MTAPLAEHAIVAHRYEIREPITELPTYLEYRAFDLEVEVDVAVWWIRRELFPSSEASEGLIAGVKRMRDLRHGNVRRVFDAGWEDDGIYITAQLASFDRVVPRAPAGAVLDSADLLHFATSVIDGLSAAHLHGCVHGRLIPKDIVHVARLIKVTGIGLYENVERYAAGQLWEPYLDYLAPEVIAGEPAGVRADVYSVAKIIAEIAGGLDAIQEHLPELAEVFADACAGDPGARTPSVEDLLDLLRGVLIDGRVPTNERAAIMPQPEPLGPLPTNADTGEYTLDSPMDEDLIATIQNAAPVPALGDGPIDLTALHLDDSDTDLPRNRMVTRPIRKLPPSFEDRMETVLEEAGDMVTGEPPPPAPALPARMRAPTPTAERTLPFQSMKPPSEPGDKRTPPVPAIDRPEMKPRLRAISNSLEEVPSQLGTYAPPRIAPIVTQGHRPPWAVWVSAVVVAVALGFLVFLLVVRLTKGGGEQNESKRSAPASTAMTDAGVNRMVTPAVIVSPTSRAIDAGTTALRCAAGMVLVRVAKPYCIDGYESPGRGRFPTTGVSLARARAICKARKARLCSENEWVNACRGEKRGSFPYGSTFRPGVCNTKGSIRAAGSFSACRSAVGAYDMSGNVAEWVRGGIVKGGSARDRRPGRCSTKQRRHGRGAQGFGDVGFRCCAAPAR